MPKRQHAAAVSICECVHRLVTPATKATTSKAKVALWSLTAEQVAQLLLLAAQHTVIAPAVSGSDAQTVAQAAHVRSCLVSLLQWRAAKSDTGECAGAPIRSLGHRTCAAVERDALLRCLMAARRVAAVSPQARKSLLEADNAATALLQLLEHPCERVSLAAARFIGWVCNSEAADAPMWALRDIAKGRVKAGSLAAKALQR